MCITTSQLPSHSSFLFIQTILVQEWCFYKADLIIVNPSSIFFNWSSLPPEINDPGLHKQDSPGTHPLYLSKSSLNLLWSSLKVLFLLQGSASSLKISHLQWVLWFAIFAFNIWLEGTYSFRYLHCWKTKCSYDSPQAFPGLKEAFYTRSCPFLGLYRCNNGLSRGCCC